MSHNRKSKPITITANEAHLLDKIRRTSSVKNKELQLQQGYFFLSQTLRTLLDRGLLVPVDADNAHVPTIKWVRDFLATGDGHLRLSKRAQNPWIIKG